MFQKDLQKEGCRCVWGQLFSSPFLMTTGKPCRQGALVGRLLGPTQKEVWGSPVVSWEYSRRGRLLLSDCVDRSDSESPWGEKLRCSAVRRGRLPKVILQFQRCCPFTAAARVSALGVGGWSEERSGPEVLPYSDVSNMKTVYPRGQHTVATGRTRPATWFVCPMI